MAHWPLLRGCHVFCHLHALSRQHPCLNQTSFLCPDLILLMLSRVQKWKWLQEAHICTIKWKQKDKKYIFKHLEGKKKYFDLVPYVLYLLHFLITSSSSSSSSSYVAWWCRPARTPLPPSSITACFVVLSASFCQSSCHGWTVKRWSNSAWIESTCHLHTEPWLLWASCLPACILVSKALTWLLTLTSSKMCCWHPGLITGMHN